MQSYEVIIIYHGRIQGGAGVWTPPLLAPFWLFDIGPKVGPPPGPHLFACRPKMPPPLSKILDPPLYTQDLVNLLISNALYDVRIYYTEIGQLTTRDIANSRDSAGHHLSQPPENGTSDVDITTNQLTLSKTSWPVAVRCR